MHVRTGPASPVRFDWATCIAVNSDILIFGMTQTMTIQVRGRGTLTLPATLREKYRLGDGDPLTVVDLDGVVLLTPWALVVRGSPPRWSGCAKRKSCP